MSAPLVRTQNYRVQFKTKQVNNERSDIFTIYGYITNPQPDQLPVDLIAQMIAHCTAIAEYMGSNPVQA